MLYIWPSISRRHQNSNSNNSLSLLLFDGLWKVEVDFFFFNGMLYACVEIFNKISCIWRRDNFWMKRTVMLAFNFNFQNYQKCVPKFAETSPAPKNSWLRACSEYTTTFSEFCFLDIIKLFIKNAWTKCFWLQYQCFFSQDVTALR